MAISEQPVSTVIKNTRLTLEMIKIEHTLFALPFAFLGAVLAAHGLPTPWQILWIVVAMVGARSAAMAFNRIADRGFDARNPRTASRALPAGLLSVGFVWAFTIAAAGLFVDGSELGPVLLNYGIDELRFTKPVYPGTELTIRFTCKEKLPQDPKEENDIPKGIVKWYVEIFDDTDEITGVATILTMVEMKSKP